MRRMGGRINLELIKLVHQMAINATFSPHGGIDHFLHPNDGGSSVQICLVSKYH